MSTHREERIPWSPPRRVDLQRRLAACTEPSLAAAAARLQRPASLTQHRLDLPGGPVEAWHCVADTTLGPALCLTHLEAAPSADEVQARAVAVALGAALFGLPFGGAAASLGTLLPSAALARAWHRAFEPHPDRRILAGPPALISALFTEHSRSAFSNLPESLGGLPERAGARARGAFLAVQSLARRIGLRRGARVAFQGDTPTARRLAELLAEVGYTVAPPWSPPVVEEPAPPPLVPDGGEADVLIVALPWGIHPGNVGPVRPRLLVELAVGGVAAPLDTVLREQAVPVLPDFLVRGGEAVAAALERGAGWPPPDAEAVRNHLAAAVERVVRAVWDEATSQGRTAREAALILALRRLAAAQNTLGNQ